MTPPDLDNFGRPSAALTGPRGAIPVEAAVYVGIGFVVGTTTRRRPCLMVDDLTYVVGSDFGGLMSLTKTAAAFEPFAPPAGSVPGSLPAVSRKMLARLSLGAAGATGQAHLYMDRGDGVAAAPAAIGVGSLSSTPLTQVAANVAQANVVFFFNPANPKIWVGGTGLGVGDNISLTPVAYDHRVARIASQGRVAGRATWASTGSGSRRGASSSHPPTSSCRRWCPRKRAFGNRRRRTGEGCPSSRGEWWASRGPAHTRPRSTRSRSSV